MIEVTPSDIPFLLMCLIVLLFVAYAAGDFFGWRRGREEAEEEFNEAFKELGPTINRKEASK
ncbi:MAG TPA: hypothetical protein VNQ90_17810 [Chthoniobacteraceae bacterium]|nr:hypothetical protein [Chthoniobacteraceae bacterium]